MGIINNSSGYNDINDTFNDYDGSIGIEYRGNSSSGWDKKPYLIELRLANGENNNQSILGLPAENDWVIHAPWVDKTLMRNAIVYDLLREMGSYAPRTAHIELILNGEYLGVFLVVEKLKIDDNRIDIAKPSTENITGGYLLEMTTEGRLGSDEPYITGSRSNKPFAINSPDTEDLTTAHQDYIQGYIDDFEEALYNKVYTGDSGYRNYIDVPSFLDHMLVAEIVRQLDLFTASQYFYKDNDEKLKMGPGWDYNRSFGNYDGLEEYFTNTIWASSTSRGSDKTLWGKYLYEDPAFQVEYIARYTELRTNLFSNASLNAKIDAYAEILDQAKDRNFECWDYALETNYAQPQPSSCDTYEEEIDYVKDWLEERTSWLDSNWGVKACPTINEIYADGSNSGMQWIELFNPFETSISLSDCNLAVNTDEYVYEFPQGTIMEGGTYKIVCVQESTFLGQYPTVSSSELVEGFNYSFTENTVKMSILSSDSVVMNSIDISIENGWPMIEFAGNYSMGVTPYYSNNTEGHNWNWSLNAYGTPGAKNVLFDYSGLVFSEVMSSNGETILDENQESDDWIEIYNASDHAINLTGLFISDNTSEPWEYEFPSASGLESILWPDECVIVWADKDEEQGMYHANFKLTRDSVETIVLSYYDGFKYRTIDEVTIDNLEKDKSFQRTSMSDDDSWLVSAVPTPGIYSITTSDQIVGNVDLTTKLYPNPAHEMFNVDIQLEEYSNIDVRMYDLNGKVIRVVELLQGANAGHYSFSVQVGNNIKRGIYVVEIRGGNQIHKQRLVLY
jgi:hypothetical protein